ncbi:MAG: cysteine peptidase family C39 domain-containing protein [Ignavibacteria bacterium]
MKFNIIFIHLRGYNVDEYPEMTYHRQETEFSCGPASIRNALLSMGYKVSERKIRKLAGSDKNNGTSEKKLLKALRVLDFKYKEFYNKSESAFKQRVIYNLKKNNRLVILTDNEDHWISVVGYEYKHLSVIDPEVRRVKKQLTPKELSMWCRNFNKTKKDTYYYGIIIIHPDGQQHEK